MDFGLIYELQLPKPHTREREREVFQNCVDQVRLADELGFSHVWHVEHHFLTEFAHSSAPDALLGAYAAVTERIRLGFGVKLLPFNYNHPIRVAEQVATLDLLSGGRVEFGTGRSSTGVELGGFGIDPEETRDQWRESLEIVLKCWRDEEVAWDSPTMSIPPRNVVPKPYQQPHPPLWMAVTGPESHDIAGELGLGCLSFSIATPLDKLAARIDRWRTAQRKAKPIGQMINDNAATFVLVHVADTDEQAREQARAAQMYYVKGQAHLLTSIVDLYKGREDMGSYGYMQKAVQKAAQKTVQKTVDSLDAAKRITFEKMDDRHMCIVGNPDTVIKKVQRYIDTGCTQVLGNFQGFGMTSEQVFRSIELFGREVIPAFNGAQ